VVPGLSDAYSVSYYGHFVLYQHALDATDITLTQHRSMHRPASEGVGSVTVRGGRWCCVPGGTWTISVQQSIDSVIEQAISGGGEGATLLPSSGQ